MIVLAALLGFAIAVGSRYWTAGAGSRSPCADLAHPADILANRKGNGLLRLACGAALSDGADFLVRHDDGPVIWTENWLVLQDVEGMAIVLAGRHILQVVKVRIFLVAVFMVDLMLRRRISKERASNEDMHRRIAALITDPDRDAWISATDSRRKDASDASIAAYGIHSGDANRSKIGNLIAAFVAYYRKPSFYFVHVVTIDGSYYNAIAVRC